MLGVRKLIPVMALAALAGCTSYSVPVMEASEISSEPAPLLLGAGDKLRIRVFGEERLTGEYSVSADGNVVFPLIGSVQAQDRTVDQLQVAMRDALASGYIEDPRLAIEVIDFRPFYILGEVNRPGEYPYVAGLTLQQAIATAGGYTYRAKRDRVRITRSAEDAERELRLDGTSVAVQPGDTIMIPERFF
ncbi:polysaccharide export protein [Alteraurantiacibacter aquimixticola]|uniref:Polysaccharide export protein n=2 Tax=Alteraurantiacibacter aquimixticola TaxID=2489173 RepID=A0A4T3F5G0_9SPHN|nr:polysaccharide export protein [Alteraurantiacibacter aquimixticola]